eukprot:CAMPEP_0113913630 /NCGR_PEP_ID=MMETSP0780_2-20120614/29704_1 /TAXON_ID=652834 /ORGANISM="Palpitomonas bilix" /LENGTH=39 /DNA_ID=CAMNT_0000910951 /DNA_START=83 /DNA_END=199 /DNA_ORIENTATION=- /assembly_acc=CAM_ASM_000599
MKVGDMTTAGRRRTSIVRALRKSDDDTAEKREAVKSLAK